MIRHAKTAAALVAAAALTIGGVAYKLYMQDVK